MTNKYDNLFCGTGERKGFNVFFRTFEEKVTQ